jgi:hypothetical protein
VNSCFKEVDSDNIRGTSLQRTVSKEMIEPLPKECSSEMNICEEEGKQNIEIRKAEENFQKVGYNRFNLLTVEKLEDKSIKSCLVFLKKQEEESIEYLQQKKHTENKINQLILKNKLRTEYRIKNLKKTLNRLNLENTCKEEKRQSVKIKKTKEKPQKVVGYRFNLFNAEELKSKSIEEKYDNYIQYLKYYEKKEINEEEEKERQGFIEKLNNLKLEGIKDLKQKQKTENKIKKLKSKLQIKTLKEKLWQINADICFLEAFISVLIEDPSMRKNKENFAEIMMEKSEEFKKKYFSL